MLAQHTSITSSHFRTKELPENGLFPANYTAEMHGSAYWNKIRYEIRDVIDSFSDRKYLEFYQIIPLRVVSVDKVSTKREKFVRLAEGRTQSALTALRKIGNLSNRRAYEYDEADVRKIIRALREAITDVERRFSATGDQSDRFRL